MGLPHRYVFVAGLHRSGTSCVAGLIAEHDRVSGIEGAPVPENEGCYLQGGIPHTAVHGIPGRFAVDPEQHHIEGCRYDRLETRQRMEADWSRWFDPAKPWRVEKSPVNLTRMRLYQSLFPLSQFVIVMRHPACVAAAMAKWDPRPATDLVEYWLDAHDRVFRDIEHLHAAIVLRYEDLVADPARTARRLWAFLDLPEGPVPPIHDGNAAYTPAPLTPQQQARARRWGYEGSTAAMPAEPIVRHPLRTVRNAVLG
jgi:hypothetical protein